MSLILTPPPTVMVFIREISKGEHWSVISTDLIVDWIKLLYYRKMKPISIGAKLPPVTTLQQKYGVVLQNELARRVSTNAILGHSQALGRIVALLIKKTKYFLSFERKF